VSAGFAARMSRNYRIVTDRRKRQSVFGDSRDMRRTPAARRTQHNFITIARTKTPECELHYFDRWCVTLSRHRRIGL